MELELTASDRGSGLAAFYVEVYNQVSGTYSFCDISRFLHLSLRRTTV